jgi:hypothetical protein
MLSRYRQNYRSWDIDWEKYQSLFAHIKSGSSMARILFRGPLLSTKVKEYKEFRLFLEVVLLFFGRDRGARNGLQFYTLHPDDFSFPFDDRPLGAVGS